MTSYRGLIEVFVLTETKSNIANQSKQIVSICHNPALIDYLATWGQHNKL